MQTAKGTEAMSFKLQRYEERPATIQEHRELRDEVHRLRLRESELLHWLRQAQLKAENAKQKAMVARDNADHAIQYALDAEVAATRALSSPNHTK